MLSIPELNRARDEIRTELESRGGVSARPESGQSRAYTAGRFRDALKLVWQEPEILVFALMQWVIVGVFYYLFIQVIDWVPDSVWEQVQRDIDADRDSNWGAVIGLAITGWGLLTVVVAAYPIGILTGAMGMAHFLRASGRASTFADCLYHAVSHSTRLWLFHAVDGWITVNRILDRLPKKRDRESAASKAAKELMYYAWKLVTMGVTPAILNGRGMLEAAKESVGMLRSNWLAMLKLRGGYSFLNWIVGIGAYVLGCLWLITMPDLFEGANSLYRFYVMAGVPIVIAAGVVMLFLRPLYVICLCQAYADYLKQTGGQLDMTGRSTLKADIALVIFMLVLMLGIVFNAQHLGVIGWFEQQGAAALLKAPR